MATTDYRLTTLSGTELFNFNNATTGTAVGMEPHIENQQVRLMHESNDLRSSNLSSAYKTGLSPRDIVLMGSLVDDSSNSNQWRLSSLVLSDTVIKLWGGSQWFCYVLGKQSTFIRNGQTPNLWDYTINFTAFDPFWYYANSGGGAAGDNGVDPLSVTSTSNYIDIDLSGTGANQGSTYVEPFFLIKGGSGTDVTSSEYISFQDEYGRKLTFTPSDDLGDDEAWIICPYYFGESKTGYRPQRDTAYKIPSGNYTAGSSWVLDRDCWDGNYFVHASSDLVRVSCNIENVDVSAVNLNPRWRRSYPRADDGIAGGAGKNRITVTTNGDLTDAVITAEYMLRRL